MTVTDETTFLTLLDEQPADDDTRLVYADWLEGQGELQRAEVLRGIVALNKISFANRRILGAARALLEKSRGLVVEWLERVSHPRLEGAAWGLRNSASTYLLGFHADGKLQYKRSDDETAGTWGQVGRAVWFAINDYSAHEGVFSDGNLKGEAASGGNTTWRFRGMRIEPAVLAAPELPAMPRSVCDTPYVENERLPDGAPRLRERLTAKGAVWWVKRPRLPRPPRPRKKPAPKDRVATKLRAKSKSPAKPKKPKPKKKR